MATTLVYSTRRYPKSNTLSVWEPDSATKLISRIFAEKFSSKRLIVSRNKYFYQPSEDYKQYLVRFKGIRK